MPQPEAIVAVTPDRAAINRANAQHSTGPRTPEGKAKMRFNAFQHGLYSETVVLPHEDFASFHKFDSFMDAKFSPQTEEERKLVETLKATEWRLGRVCSIESGILAIATDEQIEATREKFDYLDDISIQVLAQSAGYLARSRELDQLSRHEARLTRLRDRTERDLKALQSARVPRPASASGSVPKKSPAPAAAAPPGPPPPPTPAPSAAPSHPKMPKFSGPMRKQHRKQWLREQARKNGGNGAA